MELNAKMRLLQKSSPMKSMELVEIPKVWWRKPQYIQNMECLRILVWFIVMNAGRANRLSGYDRFAFSLSSGRVIQYPLCSMDDNNEIHILINSTGMRWFSRNDKIELRIYNGRCPQTIWRNSREKSKEILGSKWKRKAYILHGKTPPTFSAMEEIFQTVEFKSRTKGSNPKNLLTLHSTGNLRIGHIPKFEIKNPPHQLYPVNNLKTAKQSNPHPAPEKKTMLKGSGLSVMIITLYQSFHQTTWQTQSF